MKKHLFIVCVTALLCACQGKTAHSGTSTNPHQGEQDTIAHTEANTDINTAINTDTIVEADDRDYIVKVGDMAPLFTLPIYNSDQSFSLADTKGKIVMLQFTASWCSVCRKEMPHIEAQIWNKYKDNDNFVLYAIDREEDDATINKFIAKTGITYPVLKDTASMVFDKYALHDSGITRNIIINGNGEIVMLTRLYDEAEFATMCHVIDSLLNTK